MLQTHLFFAISSVLLGFKVEIDFEDQWWVALRLDIVSAGYIYEDIVKALWK